MSTALILAAAGAGLFAMGMAATVLMAHLLRRILALNVMTSGAFFVLVGLAQRQGAGPDAVPQAMVLTGIVVAVAATALALALVRKLYALTGSAVLPAATDD